MKTIKLVKNKRAWVDSDGKEWLCTGLRNWVHLPKVSTIWLEIRQRPAAETFEIRDSSAWGHMWIDNKLTFIYPKFKSLAGKHIRILYKEKQCKN